MGADQNELFYETGKMSESENESRGESENAAKLLTFSRFYVLKRPEARFFVCVS